MYSSPNPCGASKMTGTSLPSVTKTDFPQEIFESSFKVVIDVLERKTLKTKEEKNIYLIVLLINSFTVNLVGINLNCCKYQDILYCGLLPEDNALYHSKKTTRK